MEMRMFGRTGLELSVLGLGCGAVGGLMVRGDPLDQKRTIAQRQFRPHRRCRGGITRRQPDAVAA
jgi:aryl-alcohol dehydrogenase-like predicted oxidoreductase